MTTALAKAENQAPRPLLPASLARLTDDPTDHEGRPLPWARPRTLPAARDVREALGTLRVYLTPAADRQISDCLARMALVMRSKDGSQGEWKARAGEYIRLLQGYPSDIWNEECDKLMGESPFFPTPADLKARLDAALSLRHRRIRRLEAMIEQPKPNAMPEMEPRPKRLRTVIDAWKGLPESSVAKGALGASARNAERELAEIENRPVEEWAA